MIIREMVLSDASVINNIAKDEEGFRVAQSEISCFWTQEQLEKWIGSGEDVLLVAEVENEVVGFVLTAFHRPNGKAYWENQYVLPEYRGRGIGKALTHEMTNRLKAKGATYLHFLVKSNNEELKHYEKIGFERGSEFIWFGMRL